MKLFIKNTLFFIFITIITLLSLFFIYQSYISYKSYKIAQNADIYLPHIKNTDELLNKIEQECALSAFYLAKNAKVDFSQIQIGRDETDKAIKKADKFIKESPKFLKDLQYVRSRVDVASSDYKDIIFTYYKNELSNPLLKEIDTNIQELSFGVEELKTKLQNYNKLINKRNNISREKSFITYILVTSKKMDNQDMNLWDKILAKKALDESSSSDMIAIAQGITTGNYNIDIKTWLENSNNKIIQVLDNQEKVYNSLYSKIKTKKSSPQTLLFNLIITLFLLYILFTLLKSHKKSTVKKSSNKDIVKKVHISSNKNRITDKPNAELPANLKTPIHGKRSTDIPSTNSIQKENKTYIHNEEATIKSFNPMEEFAHTINHFVEKTSKKDIGFKYLLDPTIPSYCIGDIEKIQEAMHYLSNYTINSSNSKNFLTLNIENIAQTKMENAIMISLNQSNHHMPEEEIKEILDAKYETLYKKSIDSRKFNKLKINLLEASHLISKIDGRFKIKQSQDHSTDFQITVNLKRK